MSPASGSVADAVKFSVVSSSTVWLAIGSSTGALFGATSTVTVVVSGAESRLPSLTMSWMTYSPASSATKVGATAVGSLSVAALPAGTLVNDQS